MRFCRLRIVSLILPYVILGLTLFIWLSNPVSEQLCPKSVDEAELYRVHFVNEDKPHFQNHVIVTGDVLSITAKRNEQLRKVFQDLQMNETTKPGGTTTAYQDLLNQTQSKPDRTTWDIQSMTLGQTTWRPLKANDFTAEPQWKTEENYILAPSSHQTTCLISIKMKAYNMPWLKKRFLHDITIFMDARHFNDQEWKRLGHFAPPFGWMELQYPVVKEVVSALPHIADQQLLMAEKRGKLPHCVTCAVVGNGGILNGSRMGKEIDLHDYVFRVNGAVIQGYGDDVGKRTSFYGFTAYTMLSSLYMLNKRGFSTIPKDKETKYIHFTEGQRDYEWLKALQQNKELANTSLQKYRLRPRDDFGKKFDFKKLLVVHPDFARYLKNRFLRSRTLNGKDWRIYRPSTGALVLLTALHLCDVVSAYGFITEDFKKYADHYYDKTKTNVTFYINHDFPLEKDLWAHLHKENIMKLYKGTKGL